MELKNQKETAKNLYLENRKYFQEIEKELSTSEKREWNDIKSFEDACEELGIDLDSIYNSHDTPDEIAYKKLKIIAAAINQSWTPDWDNTNQKKWFPYFNLSSGFGFSASLYFFGLTYSSVGSRLCFESEAKARYAGNQFLQLYKEFLTIIK